MKFPFVPEAAPSATIVRHGTGLWYTTGEPGGVGVASVQNRLWLVRYVFTEPTSIQALGARVNTAGEAGSTLRYVVYQDVNGIPDGGALLVDSGTVAADSTGAKSKAASATLSGVVWIGQIAQSCPTTPPNMFRANRGIQGFPIGGDSLSTAAATGTTCRTADSVSGAAPSTCPATAAYNTNFPVTLFQIA